MKIPETSANVGAYYGNEENGQWQPNGVMLDSGVGGGVVGSGDAGVQRAPLYPVHMPRQHVPAGYVMAGAYYPPAPYAAPAPDDFADYMWMENEEEFDKQVMQQLEEEALMEQCIEAMLEDEQRERHNGHQYPTTSNGAPSLSLEETVSRSRLNPLAAEFVPTGVTNTQTPATQPSTEEKPDPVEAPSSEEPPTKVEAPAEHTDTHTEPQKDPTPPPSDPPEVSAAHIQDDTWRDRKKKAGKETREIRESREIRETRESRESKARAPAVRSESKLVRRERDSKRDVRARSEDATDAALEDKPTSAPVEEPPGPKPINYAAAAKANKPRRGSPPRVTPAPAPADKPSPALAHKDKKKPEKPVQRKNSAK